MRSDAALALILSVLPVWSAKPDVQTISLRSVKANQEDWNAAPNYSYFERIQRDGSSKTYHVSMILGSPYDRLVAVDDKPLSPSDQANEQQKLERVSNQRQSESPQERAERITKYEKDRKRDRLMIEQLSEAFDFNFLGSEKLRGFDVYVLAARALPGYHPPNAETKALTGMQGKLWVDQETSQWVKVKAEVVRPVSIEGFLARVEPGTSFVLEKMPVESGIWLPKHFAMSSRARVLFLFSKRKQEDDTFFDYHKSG